MSDESKAVQPVSDARELAGQIVQDVFPSMDTDCARRYIEQVEKMLEAYAAHLRSSDAQRIKELEETVATRNAQASEYNAMTHRAMDRAERAEAEVARLHKEIAEALRLEVCDDPEEGYLIPAEPEPVGPYDLVQAARNLMHLMDEWDKKDRDEIRDLKTEVARLTQENELLKQKFTTAQKDAYAIEARLKQENADVHKILDLMFERFPSSSCANCREHSIGYRVAAWEEALRSDLSAKARKAAHELICTRSVLVAPITASFSEAEDFLEAIILRALTEGEENK